MDLGLQALIDDGFSPAAARQLILHGMDLDMVGLLVMMASSAKGQRLLHEGVAVWGSYGLQAPWIDLLEDTALLPETVAEHAREGVS